MQKFNKRMDRQFRNSNEAGFVSASSNNIRRRTAAMVYRQRNIDMKEVERAAYLTLVKSTKTLSALFQPDPKDKLDFHDLSGVDKWKRIFKQKHWKAFTKDPKARKRNSSEQTFDNFHNFRVNLPFLFNTTGVTVLVCPAFDVGWQRLLKRQGIARVSF